VTRRRSRNWRPVSRKAQLREQARTENLDRNPRDSLEMLRWTRRTHPNRLLPPEAPDERREARDRVLGSLNDLPPDRLGDLYHAHAQMLKPARERSPTLAVPKSASSGETPSTVANGTNEMLDEVLGPPKVEIRNEP